MSTITSAPSSSLSSQEKAACIPNPNPPQPLNPLPAGFDPHLAYLLGLCCDAANEQYSTYVTNTPMTNLNDPKGWQIQSVKATPWNPDFSQILAQGYTPQTLLNLTVSEKDVTGKFVEIPAGYIVRLDPKDITKSSMIVVAFHGTHNSYELKTIDFDIKPAMFGTKLGSVHGGFYAQYTTGYSSTPLAGQIYSYLDYHNRDGALPVKVTGHSLGGALATLCAVDIAYNCKPNFKSISMYSLASPRLADALTLIRGDAATFVSNYQQQVPDSYRIVNTVDPVPNSPTALVPPPPTPRLQFPPPPWIPMNACAHVLGDIDAIAHGIANPSPLDQNVVSFTDSNLQNGEDSPQECQGPHSCSAVYLPFLKKLASAS
jgi:hypothetical protein